MRARIQGLVFVFVNVYAHNTGRERTVLFKALRQELSHVEQDNILVLGEDFNCTIDPHSDRRSEEPHVGSAGVLVEIVADYDLVDTWRVKHPDKRGFTWVKAGPDRVSAARLDRLYIFRRHNNRLVRTLLSPAVFSDHYMVQCHINISPRRRQSEYWKFNGKLLQDAHFLSTVHSLCYCRGKERNQEDGGQYTKC